MSTNKFLTSSQAAERCGVDRATIVRWVHEKKLRSISTNGGHNRILESDINQFLVEKQVPNDELDNNDNRPCVLVIDDDDDVRGTIANMLKVGDYRTLEADNGYQGLNLLLKDRNKCKIKLVVLDLLLPGFDGKQILAECKRIRGDVAVIVVSGKLDWFDLKNSELLPDDVLEKPIEVGELIIHCEQLLGNHGTKLKENVTAKHAQA